MWLRSSAGIFLYTIGKSNMRGVQNVGASCYAAACLQAMAACASLAEAVQRHCQTVSDEVLNSLAAILAQLRAHPTTNSDGGTVGPHMFLAQAAAAFQSSMTISRGRQNDASELLGLLLQRLLDKGGQVRAAAAASSPSFVRAPQGHPMLAAVDRDWDTEHKTHTLSPFIDLLCGQLVHVIKCGNCGARFFSGECFTTLFVDPPTVTCRSAPPQWSIQEALRRCVTRREDLDGWKCDRCKVKGRSTRSTRLWRVPKVLTIVLRRYNDAAPPPPIDIETELDVRRLTLLPPALPQAPHMLKAAICHHGRTDSGHYTAMVRPRGSWFMADDELVAIVDVGRAQKLMSMHGYVFVFEQGAAADSG